MKKVLIDTNVWLRYFLEDTPTQVAICQKMFASIEAGHFRPYVSNITLFEIAYTLKTHYRLSILQIKKILTKVLKTRNIVIIDKTNSKKAILLFFAAKIKYADCLIATQVRPGMKLVTYDHEFSKVIPRQVATPQDLITID